MNTPQTQNTMTINDVIYLDSRLVAELAGKEHGHLLREIRQYDSYLKNANEKNPKLDSINSEKGSNLSVTDFWVEDTYTAKNGKTQPCYLISKKGCEFIQHKMTGRKGAIFTAKYINAFHDMKEQQPTLALNDDLAYFKAKTKAAYENASDIETLGKDLLKIFRMMRALYIE